MLRAADTRSVPGTSRRGAAAGLPLVGILALLAISCGSDGAGLEPQDVLVEESGGETTAFNTTRNAFSLSARNLTRDERRTFEVGDSFFNQNWVTAPSSTPARDGLGPTFNAASCSSCHGLDGRAQPPLSDDDPQRGLLIRLSLPPHLQEFFAPDAPPGAPVPDPMYGGQLQDRAINGVTREGRIVIAYTEVQGAYADGEPYVLIAPAYTIEDRAFGPLHPEIQISPRIAPAVFGVGLLEAIPEEAIRALVDPEDEDGDGISGRVNIVWDLMRERFTLGRFGWKATQPTVLQQAAGAFHGDIGITSPLFPEQNCTPVQEACASAPGGGDPEVPDERLQKVAFYNRTLAVPAARDRDDPEVERGAEFFFAASCHLCHTPQFTTGEHSIGALSGQTIFPYTDLLLHDMGEGLADDRPVFDASGREWRTPPLWGIGLVETVNGHTRFLHDGRARNLAEAILWHGGEAEAAKEYFRNLPAEDREALIAFLESL